MRAFAALCIAMVTLPAFAELIIVPGPPATASPDRLWQEIPIRTLNPSFAELRKRFPRSVPNARVERVFLLDATRLETMLNGAPFRRLLASKPAGGKVITLPLPNAEYVRFSVFETPVLDPELAAALPGLRTYSAVGVDRPTMTASIEKTASGWSAMLFGEQGMVAISRIAPGIPNLFLSITPSMMNSPTILACKVPSPTAAPPPVAGTVPQLPASFGGSSRIYRLAMAARGSYTTKFGQVGDSNATIKSKAMFEIAVLVARLNQVFGNEFGIQFNAIPQQPDIVFLPANDPYACQDAFTCAQANPQVLTNIVGLNNFDIGHVLFAPQSGGDGYGEINGVCRTNLKASGSTGEVNPVGDPFYIGYVAHEIGHQFGGNHTFNGTLGSCNNARNPRTTFEPGSGSTIMGYAPICPGQNVVLLSEAYFHSVSVAEIVADIKLPNGSGSCSTATANGNRPPAVTMNQAAIRVPKGTPFALSVTGSDPDGDVLLYTYEQHDLAEDKSPPDNDSGGKLRPMFRSVRMVDTTRALPSIDNLIHGKPPAKSFESMPQSGKPLTFRVLARDQRGGFAFADASVEVVTSAGPFVIQKPKPSAKWKAGSQQTVTWDPAKTKNAPLSCNDVRISMSTDGGKTFTTLIASTDNDGAEVINVPAAPTKGAVVRIEALNQPFFAVSRVFAIRK